MISPPTAYPRFAKGGCRSSDSIPSSSESLAPIQRGSLDCLRCRKRERRASSDGPSPSCGFHFRTSTRSGAISDWRPPTPPFGTSSTGTVRPSDFVGIGGATSIVIGFPGLAATDIGPVEDRIRKIIRERIAAPLELAIDVAEGDAIDKLLQQG